MQVAQWAAYHSSANFSQPELFAPERWLQDPSSIFAFDKRDVFEPFSIGPRNCIGKNLAWLEMRLILARVLWSFDLELQDAEWDPDKQDVYVLWQKPALNVKLRARKA